MFTPEQRARLRNDLLDCAARDPRISGAAITGSAAAEKEDRWSDIDLAFGIAEGIELAVVLSAWTDHMYAEHQALHHLDVRAGAWIYRVFLLPGTLQVDLAFAPAAEFRALGPTFRLVSGEASEARHAAPPAHADLIGLGWLYAIHGRTCIARAHLWQAEYMISGVRDHALALACVRHGLPAVHGRGLDSLPREIISRFESALVRELTPAELARAFRVAVDRLLDEIRSVDGGLAERLRDSLTLMQETASPELFGQPG